MTTTQTEPTSAVRGLRAGRQQVIRREREWHERQAPQRYSLDRLLYAPPAFDAVVEAGVAYLGLAPGQRVLELASGEGKEALALARRGLAVVSTDLSLSQLARSRSKLAEANLAAGARFVQANAEDLPFAPESFDAIYGKAILHHLDLRLAAAEVARLLPAGARASFAEPLARHPLIWLGRRLTPRLRTTDERPPGLAELQRFAAQLAGAFGECEVQPFFLLSPLAYGLRLLPGGEAAFRWLHRRLQRLDAWLLKRFPALGRFAWYGVINVRRAG